MQVKIDFRRQSSPWRLREAKFSVAPVPGGQALCCPRRAEVVLWFSLAKICLESLFGKYSRERVLGKK